MLDMRQQTFVNAVVEIVREISPADAVQTVLLAEVDEDYTCTRVEFRSQSGPMDSTAWVELCAPRSEELSDALLELRDAMVAQGSKSRFGLTFTVLRSGGFEVSVTYDMPDDLPWID
jgi:hypothetical protein